MSGKNIYICRHSQAEHNVANDYSIPDAPLTPLGKRQSGTLPGKTAALQQQIEVVLSSPLKRTLQSTRLGWGPAVDRLGGPKKVVCLPQLQECNDFPCDTGSPRQVLEADAEFNVFDLSNLTPDWTSKQGFYAADEASLTNRARWVRQYLRSRPEKNILVVAHGDVIRRITASASGPSTYMWKNAEVRLFRFDEATVGTDECFLVPVADVTIAGGYEPTSTDLVEEEQAAAKGAGIANGSGLLGSGSFGGGEGDDLLSAVDAAGSKAIAEMEQRVRSKQSAVASQADELAQLEARLAEAEKRKAELEAKGLKV